MGGSKRTEAWLYEVNPHVSDASIVQGSTPEVNENCVSTRSKQRETIFAHFPGADTVTQSRVVRPLPHHKRAVLVLPLETACPRKLPLTVEVELEYVSWIWIVEGQRLLVWSTLDSGAVRQVVLNGHNTHRCLAVDVHDDQQYQCQRNTRKEVPETCQSHLLGASLVEEEGQGLSNPLHNRGGRSQTQVSTISHYTTKGNISWNMCWHWCRTVPNTTNKQIIKQTRGNLKRAQTLTGIIMPLITEVINDRPIQSGHTLADYVLVRNSAPAHLGKICTLNLYIPRDHFFTT